MLIFYLVVLIAALYAVSKMLLPEMAKPPLPNPPKRSRPLDTPQPEASESRVEKLEALLTEKNKSIAVLQSELKMFYVQVVNFDKIRSLLEDEVHHLREQNRIFRSELGIPPIASSAEHKENSLT